MVILELRKSSTYYCEQGIIILVASLWTELIMNTRASHQLVMHRFRTIGLVNEASKIEIDIRIA